MDSRIDNKPKFQSKKGQKKNRQTCLGFVTFFKDLEGYGFIVTYGENFDPSNQSISVQEVFFRKENWKSDVEISDGICVTFTIERTKEKMRAYNVCPIICSQEVYSIGKLHIGKYSCIKVL